MRQETGSGAFAVTRRAARRARSNCPVLAEGRPTALAHPGGEGRRGKDSLAPQVGPGVEGPLDMRRASDSRDHDVDVMIGARGVTVGYDPAIVVGGTQGGRPSTMEPAVVVS